MEWRTWEVDQIPHTARLLDEGVEKGVFPGAVVGFWSKSDPNNGYLYAYGKRRLHPSVLSLGTDTPFDLSSVSKVYVTAPLIHCLVERGLFSYDTPVSNLLPDFRHPSILIRHLLSHTAGFEAWKPFYEDIRKRFEPTPLEQIKVSLRHAALRDLVMKTDPISAPGKKAVYSDLCFLLLGYVIEETLQHSLSEAAKIYLWKPMGMKESFYSPVYSSDSSSGKSSREGQRTEVAATEKCPWRGKVLQGQVHDDNAWAAGGIEGHTGVFAPAADLLLFSKKILGTFFTPQTKAKMWQRVPLSSQSGEVCERTLGWDTPSLERSSVGKRMSRNSVGHWGFTGTSLWLDLDRNWAVVLLTNRVHPTRENHLIKDFRPRFHDALYEDLLD